jgi:hypothetical protein
MMQKSTTFTQWRLVLRGTGTGAQPLLATLASANARNFELKTT